MPAHTLTATVRDSMAIAVYGKRYASLSASQQHEIDQRMAQTSTKFRRELKESC